MTDQPARVDTCPFCNQFMKTQKKTIDGEEVWWCTSCDRYFYPRDPRPILERLLEGMEELNDSLQDLPAECARFRDGLTDELMFNIGDVASLFRLARYKLRRLEAMDFSDVPPPPAPRPAPTAPDPPKNNACTYQEEMYGYYEG